MLQRKVVDMEGTSFQWPHFYREAVQLHSPRFAAQRRTLGLKPSPTFTPEALHKPRGIALCNPCGVSGFNLDTETQGAPPSRRPWALG